MGKYGSNSYTKVSKGFPVFPVSDCVKLCLGTLDISLGTANFPQVSSHSTSKIKI